MLSGGLDFSRAASAGTWGRQVGEAQEGRLGGGLQANSITSFHPQTTLPPSQSRRAVSLHNGFYVRIIVRRILKSRKAGREEEKKRQSSHPLWARSSFIYGLHPHFLLPLPQSLCFVFWELTIVFSADFLYLDHHIKSDHLGAKSL